MPASPFSPSMPRQVDYLFNRLLKAAPNELPVLRDALKAHQFQADSEALDRAGVSEAGR